MGQRLSPHVAEQTTIPLPTPREAQAGQGGYLALLIPPQEGELQAQAMENWYQACSSDDPFSLELVAHRHGQGFVLRASSRAQLTLLCKQLQAQYPQLDIRPLDPAVDPLAIHPGEHAVVGEFGLAKASWMPIKTFPAKALIEAGSDPLANLLAAMETSQRGERIISQLALLRTADDWIAPAIRRAVEHPLQKERDQFAASLKSSDSGADLRRGWGILILIGFTLAAVLGYRWYHSGALLPLSALLLAAFGVLLVLLWWWIRQGNKEIYDMRLVSDKLMRSGFSFRLRVIVIGREDISTQQDLRERITQMEVAYRQFALASANSLILKKVRTLTPERKEAQALTQLHKIFTPYASLLHALRGASRKDICNSLELSGLYHLPQQATDLPLVERTTIKRLLFSPEVAYAIDQSQDALPPVEIGVSSHRDLHVPVKLPTGTQFAHKFVVGRSRYGKSVLMQLLVAGILQPVRDHSPQPGVFVIDPHRDLIFDVLASIPQERANDVLLFDFTDGAHVVGLNPLDCSMGLSRDQIIASLMSCFEKIWDKYWGPRMAYFLKNVCLLLCTLNAQLCAQGRAQEQYTLLDINPLLQYKDYATLVLNQLDHSEPWHQELMAWWQHTYWTLPTNSSFRQEIILPILSKMGVFHDNLQLRRIFGQSVTTAPVHEAVTHGKIVLCALSARDMDESSVNILGSTLINTLHYAFTRQQEIPLLFRRKCAVFIDELQNFVGSQFSKLLSEDSKWGCAALLTTQSLKRLNQLQDGLQEMLFSNCDNLYAFNVSAIDAKILEAEFQERMSQKHIMSQPQLHCYARIAIPGHPQQFASITLAHPASWYPTPAREALSQDMIQRNQARFLPANLCDRQQAEHLKKFLDISLFADRIKKDAEAIEDRRQKREEERQREAEVLRGQDQHEPLSPEGQEASDLEVEPVSITQPGPEAAHTGHIQAEAPPAPERAKRKRTRSRRMRRLKKTPTGAPPPGLEDEDEMEDEDGEDEAEDGARPFSSGGRPSRFWGVEGRERERGG